MDPQGRFGTIDQALRYAEEYTAQLTEAYGRREMDSNSPTRGALDSLASRLVAGLSGLEKHITDRVLQAILHLILSVFPKTEEEIETDDLTQSAG